MTDDDTRYEAVSSRDARFDGEFFFAVRTTGIYCRPSCPAVTPKRQNVAFFPTAAAAQGHGFRACRRCRPDAVPGSAAWDVRADVVGRAMRMIGDGVVDREGVPGLAGRLGYSTRQVQRQLTAELGAGPVALARAQRAHTARLLLQTTGLPVTEIAFAAGFASVRQFNETIRAVYARTPSALRAVGGRGGGARTALAAG
ncbi:bifunctional transcriptional activator/DNA repair enzyme AdaA, partial [Streptomyces venezuelae]|uniref:bifunctional transcriptional activator/DNA repair enzyme AdaA n=1 Tax=Streptomyces venezuelae TaxID=54571 RepID=UPI00278C8AFC